MPDPIVLATPTPNPNAANKIEEGGPYNGLTGREHTRRYNRGNGIRRIVKPVQKIEHQCR
jgi:hypothetical protein